MKKADGIGERLLSICFVLLILIQSLRAVSQPSPFDSLQDISSKKTEVQQNLLPKAQSVGTYFRLTLSAFLFYSGSGIIGWLRVFNTSYLSGRAYLLRPFVANCYYAHLSALAP